MKRFLIILSILTLVSVGALGCKKKAADPTSESSTQEASIEVKDADKTSTQTGTLTITNGDDTADSQ